MTSRIKLAKRNWFISKNRNFYNPILKAMVYRYGITWSIARYGKFSGAFELKEEAMVAAFQMWLEEKRITEIAKEIEDELKEIKHKILNEYKYRIFDRDLLKFASKGPEGNIIESLPLKRIMIFGRPGSGKSTFANWLSGTLHLPLYHLDKYFYVENWVERDYGEFLRIQQGIVERKEWIVDGNSISSLETRFKKADLVLYLNFPKPICYFRILKRYFKPNASFDDRASGCGEVIRWPLLKYMWTYEQRVGETIHMLKARYSDVVFKEIKNDKALNKLKNELAKL